MNVSATIAKDLLQINAIKLNPDDPFTWASGMRSPIYCDNRITLSYPETRNRIKTAFAELINTIEGVDAIVGVATAGIPHGALAADACGLPFAYVRSKAKEHGRKNLIEGELKKGQRCVVIEDLFSTGGSAIQVVKALEELEIEVITVLSVFTYGLPKAKKNFDNANCKYASLVSFDDLLSQAIDDKYISSNQEQLLKEWSQDPQAWSDKFLSK